MIIQYNPIKFTFYTNILIYGGFYMFGIRGLIIRKTVVYTAFYSVVYMHQYNSLVGGLLILMHVKRNILYLYIQSSSRR
jgi:hypothetical protein